MIPYFDPEAVISDIAALIAATWTNGPGGPVLRSKPARARDGSFRSIAKTLVMMPIRDERGRRTPYVQALESIDSSLRGRDCPERDGGKQETR